ncbi:SSI family serine proteinase inhibitor [Streptomyces bugieae]|uniref:SSI family serine proteinase inhibitor n=1 Tax=Streptomyces bugieae TaxID=3098223 RepID=A0ABU7NPU7_9ACTN|nr:SSI family serine proteinase inhibitor [Streptomyces sp. DSM 41528]
MSHRRTSSPFAAAATAVTAATAVLALVAPVASAAPIPLPHYRSGDGVTGAGHHAPNGSGPEGGGHGGGRAGGEGALVGPDLLVGRDTQRGQLATPYGQSEGAGGRGQARRQASPARHVAHHERVGHGAHHVDPASRRVPQGAPRDHLTVTVHRSGSAHTDGTFELYCHPAHGTHHHVRRACAKLDSMTRWGKDPFAPVPQHAQCTMIYGGPATAHVSGTWAGRPVNADFRRTNGCEIERWSRFEPLLPATSS